MTREFDLAPRFDDFTIDDLRTITLASVEAAFCDDDTRQAMRARIEQGFAVV